MKETETMGESSKRTGSPDKKRDSMGKPSEKVQVERSKLGNLGLVRPRRALLSAFDVSGLVELAAHLRTWGIELIASAGTQAHLTAAGIDAQRTEELTGLVPLLGGRVKTLHPVLFASLLARSGREKDQADLTRMGANFIDLLIVNPYPFADERARLYAQGQGSTPDGSPSFDDDLVESIDIGGPSLLRAAAKNWERVTSIFAGDSVGDTTTDSGYDQLLRELKQHNGQISRGFRLQQARRTFAMTARYDAAVANHLGQAYAHAFAAEAPEAGDTFVRAVIPPLSSKGSVHHLRYGENPDQRAILDATAPFPFQPLQGETSYNNWLDMEAARRLLAAMARPIQRSAHDVMSTFLPDSLIGSVCIKHGNPCGAAWHKEAIASVKAALAGEPLASYGGVLAIAAPIGARLAEWLANRFLEVVVAVDFSEEALQILGRKKRLRLVKWVGDAAFASGVSPAVEIRRVATGYLIQQSAPDGIEPPERITKGERVPAKGMSDDLALAWAIASCATSNAIAICRGGMAIGIAAGASRRVEAVDRAARFAEEFHDTAVGSALASDGFFPFADNIERAAMAGIQSILAPMGSKRDKEVITAAEVAGIELWLSPMRRFRH